MENEEKIKRFETELGYIRNPKIREFAEKAVTTLPPYYFSVPASSSGRYHPNYALNEGGLYRHVKATVGIVLELFRLDWWKFTEDEKDLIIAALILHDGMKSGWPQQKYTLTEHPLLMSYALLNNQELHGIISDDYFTTILNAISRHMGQWVFDYKTHEEVLERPVSKIDKIVHLADYLASRKNLEYNFDCVVTRE